MNISEETIDVNLRAFENSETFIKLADKHNLIKNKCFTLPYIILKSTCILVVLGLLFTWLIYTLYSSRNNMYSKKWTSDALLEYDCYKIKDNCSNVNNCDHFDICMKNVSDYKTFWLNNVELSYGDKVLNTFSGNIMFNSEGGTIFSSMVVYVFMTMSLFITILVLFYKLLF